MQSYLALIVATLPEDALTDFIQISLVHLDTLPGNGN